jgi:hypothetical protein
MKVNALSAPIKIEKFFMMPRKNRAKEIILHTKGGFHKSWAHGVKRLRVHPNQEENVTSWVQGANA